MPFSAEAAAKVVDASPLDESATGDNRVVVKLDHNTTEAGATDRACLLRHRLPGIQGCQHRQVRQVLAHLRGQRRRPEDRCFRSSSAPLSDTMRQKVLKSIDAIETK